MGLRRHRHVDLETPNHAPSGPLDWQPIGPLSDRRGQIDRLRAENPRLNTASWRDENVHLTTVGPLWTYGVMNTFATSSEQRFFSSRTAWGRRLLVDLNKKTMLDETHLDESVLAFVKNAERERALEVLRLVPALEPCEGYSEEVHGSMAVVSEQRMTEAIPLLRLLERGSRKGTATQCVALGGDWYCHWGTSRALARHALRVLGEEPEATGNYVFTNGFPYEDDPPEDELPFQGMASVSPSQAYALAKTLTRGTSVDWVLTHMGPPDFIRRGLRDVVEGRVWTELWEYDGAEGSIRVIWSSPETRAAYREEPPRQVEKIEEVNGWRDPQRLLSMLCFFR